MILTKSKTSNEVSFANLLALANECLNEKAINNPERIRTLTPIECEELVYSVMLTVSKNTIFENKIELISGNSFPDIVADHYFGVEVKSSHSNKWKTTGNSVLESTRLKHVTSIYLFFAQLTDLPRFRFSKYELCLSDIVVTHSPRYLIDMDLEPNNTIFEKMGISYESFKNLDKPLDRVRSYFRSIVKPGEEPWWLGEDEPINELNYSYSVKNFRNLPDTQKKDLIVEVFAKFPEIICSPSSAKYNRASAYLAARHGVVSSSFRDAFSAGGKVNLSIGTVIYKSLPNVFGRLQKLYPRIKREIEITSTKDLCHYWDIPLLDSDNKVFTWFELASQECSEQSTQYKFLKHLVYEYAEKK